MRAPAPASFSNRYGLRWTLRLLLGCLLSLPAAGQPPPPQPSGSATLREFYLRTIGIEQGLAESTVSVLMQDREGFLWIGSDGMLQKYDGYGFVNYAVPSPQPGSNNVAVMALAQDAADRIWVGTNGAGLLQLLPGADHLQRVSIDANGVRAVQAVLADARQGLWIASERGIQLLDPERGTPRRSWAWPDTTASVAVMRMVLMPDGSLRVATSNGLWRIDTNNAKPQRVAAEQLPDVTTLFVDGAGHLRVGTHEGLYDVDAQGSVTRLWPAQGTAMVNAIAEDAQRRLWLAIPGQGIAIVDPDHQHTRWIRPDPLTPGSLIDANVTALQLDRSGLLWIGTHDRGLAHTDPDGVPFRYIADHNFSSDADSLNNVRALASDAAGNLWIGEGRGLKRFVIDEQRFEYIDHITVVAHGKPRAQQTMPAVTALVPTGDGQYWATTQLGVGRFDPSARTYTLLPNLPASPADALPLPQFRCVAVGSNHSLWLGSMRGGLLHYRLDEQAWTQFRHDPAQRNASLGSNMVLAVHEDHKHRVWVATTDGLNLIDPDSNTVRLFRSVPGDARSLSSDLVLSLHESANGDLWIGTQDGVNRLDSLDERGARFSRYPQGAHSSLAVYAIQDDARGHLWLGTNRGIAALDTTSNNLQTFSSAHGLQGLKYNIGASTALPNGELAFGGTDGINVFRPQTIFGSRFAAPVAITSARVGANADVRTPGTSPLRMQASDGVVRFEFAVLDFSAPERNRFAYQLEGFDSRWIEAGTRHDATYTNLAPGHYVFRVRGTNHDGFWSPQVASVALDVIPPWWASLPAKAVYTLLALTALFVWWRARRRQRRAELRHHRDLRDREDRLRLALWGSGDDFWDWDMAGDRMVMTGSSQLYMGDESRPNTRFTRWFREHVHAADLPRVEQRIDAHVRGKTENYEAEYRLRTAKGHWAWILARGKIVERDVYGQPLRMCGTTRDITVERAAEQERRIAHEVLRSMGEAVVVNDLDFRFTTVNAAFTRITGWTQAEVEGRSLSLLDCARHPAEIYSELRQTLTTHGQWRGELWQRRKNGEEFLSWCEVLEVCDANGVRTHFVGVISDITDRKRAEQELRYLANYDALTGLPNRSLLLERINQGIQRAERGNRRLAVLFLDLDRFKHINDSMGHAAGDSLLRAAGSRLRHIVRGNDSVARIGGDEFTIVLEDIEKSADAESIASKILIAFEEPLELENGQEVVISPSIGISIYPDHGTTASDLLKFADTAMYQAKEHGRRTWMIYVEAMDAAARLRAMTVAAMRKALERKEFHLRFQPKMSLRNERITGFEALLRWRSAEMGDIAPGVFIPIAEESGMIIEIGNWVIDQACHQLAQWRSQGFTDIALSINVSVAQLMDADLIRHLCDALAAHDIPPAQLELELTESMVMANAEQSITTLQRLKGIGVTLAIDDFGTGYSSLSYLKRLPIDTLKIDKEFVGDLTTDPDDEAITATVIAMAHSLSLNVVAEGVETAEQLAYLRERSCDEIQGHWLSVPLLSEECLPFVRAHAQPPHSTPVIS